MRPEGEHEAGGKIIHLRISNETIKELREIVAKLEKEHTDRRVFVDGEEFAVCSEPRSNPIHARQTRRKQAPTRTRGRHGQKRAG